MIAELCCVSEQVHGLLVTYGLGYDGLTNPAGHIGRLQALSDLECFMGKLTRDTDNRAIVKKE